MVIRVITYHALPDRDVAGWMRNVAPKLRDVPGMRAVEFAQSHGDPFQYGAVMHFGAQEDLDTYRATGPYQNIVESMRAAWLDESKPVHDQILEVLDI
ncbi:MAG: hypothetical protein V1800_15430 [Candidatus Latescibacterota bacterium]